MNHELIELSSPYQGECLVLGVFTDHDMSQFPQEFSAKHLEIMSKLCQKLAQTQGLVWQTDLDGYSLLLVNCGERHAFNASTLQKSLAKASEAILAQGVSTVTIALPAIIDNSADWQLTQMILQIEAHCYQFLDYKTHSKKPHSLHTVQFVLANASIDAKDLAEATVAGINLTKQLANLPANHCTPTILSQEAKALAVAYPQITTKIVELEEMQALGMGALLAVSQGSSEPPCLIEMTYQDPNYHGQPIVLVGKGITFDSGGLSLKPANVMDEMKYDMAGAASVFGVMKACALLELPLCVIGLVASAENMPGPAAVKPGDIVTTLSGQTVEIINTDAEGRLVLADALTYAERFKPDLVIDIATLTGAMVIALGAVNTGFMTTDESLAQDILNAAQESNDQCWRMPLEDAYQAALDSPFADMINGNFDRIAGGITGACFLSRFTKNFRWAHLDVAGTAWISGKNRQATGRPVPLLLQILRHAAACAR